MVSMVKEAEAVYGKVKDKLKEDTGKIIAIEPESGDYFIGKDTAEAYEKGHKKHPSKQFFFKRIGAETAYVVGKT